jgi:DNA-binding MarR family transcriptional regulator
VVTLPRDDLPEQRSDLDAKLIAALERVGQALRVQMWDMGKRHGLTPTQLQLLLRLTAESPARTRIGALAADLDVSHPTVSDAVAVLRRKGLVEQDSRRSPLTLTTRGYALADELAGWPARTHAEVARLDAADKEVTLQLLLDLIARLQAAGVVTVARMCTSCRFFRRDVHEDEARPHHCALMDAPLAVRDLRVNCSEHEPLSAARR